MAHERSKKGMMGQVVGSLYYLDPTVIPRLKSLRSGDDPVLYFTRSNAIRGEWFST